MTQTSDEATVLSDSPHPDGDATVISADTAAAAAAGGQKPPATLSLGYELQEYRIDKVLGQGGFGITYLASDTNLNAKVAIKEYFPSQLARRNRDTTISPLWVEDKDRYRRGLETFLVEARTLAAFRHPNIVRVARFFESNNTAYMVLEYERGESLRAGWRARSDMDESDLLRLFLPLLDGLAQVHQSGFLHGDIKPDNIYVRDSDGSLVLLDFGSASHTSAERSEEERFVSPGFGPIEQHEEGEQGPWTDIYSIGATLFWMISGKKPISAPERMLDPDPLPTAMEIGEGRYSTEFLGAIDWALKRHAKERPQDLASFRAALSAAHPANLKLQDALHEGETGGIDDAGWRAALRSPRSLGLRMASAWRAALRPGSWPLAAKMSVALVLAALVPMLLTAYYNYSGSVKSVSTSELRNIETLAGIASIRVSQHLSENRALIDNIGRDTDVRALLQKPDDATRRLVQAKLEGVAKSASFTFAMLMDATGTVPAASDPKLIGRNFKWREYFKEAMQGRSFMTGMVVGAGTGQGGVFLAGPVKDGDGTVTGVVVIRLPEETVTSKIETSREGATQGAMLIDGDGVIIHHSDKGQRLRSLVALSPALQDQIRADQRFRLSRVESLEMPDLAARVLGAKERGNVSFQSTISGKPEIAGYAPVQGTAWVIVMTQARDVFEQPLEHLLRNVLYSVAAVGLLFTLLANGFALRIVRPILALTDAAHALKRADYDKARVRVTSEDEIGRFARVFNVMIDVLRQRDRELTSRASSGGDRDAH